MAVGCAPGRGQGSVVDGQFAVALDLLPYHAQRLILSVQAGVHMLPHGRDGLVLLVQAWNQLVLDLLGGFTCSWRRDSSKQFCSAAARRSIGLCLSALWGFRWAVTVSKTEG